MMQDSDSHPIDIPPVEDESAVPDTVTAPPGSDDNGVVVTRSVRALSASRASKRLKMLSIIFALFGAVAVGIGVAYQYNKEGDAITTETTGAAEMASLSEGDRAGGSTIAIPSLLDISTPSSFFSVAFVNDGTSQFIISKKHWNKSFMVYPTIDKHSGPPHSGLERGSVMLDTQDYVFHFELSLEGDALLFVPENHRTRLSSDNKDLKDMFDNSQWPGYYMKVPINLETDDAYYIQSDIFLSSGFFVSNALSSALYTILPGDTKSFPRNSILRVEYELDNGIAVISYAIGLLPETVMDQRIADDRVGYFSTRYTLYGAESDANAFAKNVSSDTTDDDGFHYIDPQITVLNRRRLEVDPRTKKTKEPITYYIDPSVPKRWRKAFVAGVDAWKPAFEAIGFKDALRAVVPDDEDWPADYGLGDLRYNSISVMISDQTYALGPSVIDPRSGEILHSDIIFEYGFFNEVMSDFDQHSPVNPPPSSPPESSTSKSALRGYRGYRGLSATGYGHLHQCGLGQHPHHRADRMLLGMVTGSHKYVSEEIVGDHFTDIVMHEVGHTLGLRHNFAGSTTFSRKELNDDKFVAMHGLSSSIMDYVPVNIFSDLKAAKARTHRFYMTTIGAYDKAAIAYGYAVVGDEKPGSKSELLTQLARETPFFLTDEDADITLSPYGQRFDLSSDPVDFANDRLDLAKLLRKSNVVAKIPEDASWTNLWRREAALLRMINNTVDRVSPILGGVNISHAHRNKGETRYRPEYVPKVHQRHALAVLSRIISGEDGLFPAPDEYSSYIQVRGYDGEDCTAPNLEYGCLARGLVDLDHVIFYIRKKAISSALFPAMQRIVSQDVNAPLKLTELLAVLRNATSDGSSDNSSGSDDSDGGGDVAATSRDQVLRAFLVDTLQEVVDDASADVRITDAITAIFPSITPSLFGGVS